MLTEMTECGCKIKEEVKAVQSEIKENIQGTNSEGKQTRPQINDLEQKEERNTQPEQQEETKIQKNEEREPLGQFYTFQHPNHRSATGEEEEQEIGNLFENFWPR